MSQLLLCGALALAPAIPIDVAAQPSMQTILTNGPTSNRLNIVVLAEGYTNNQLAQFFVDATDALNTLLSHAPCQEYRSYFNGFAIKVASNQAGSDHPYYGIYRDTYFNSTYDSDSDYLITIPAGSTGQGKVDALLQTFMPQCQLSMLLVNDRTPGGSDGANKTAIASTSAAAAEQSPNPPGILSHEVGHVLANLGDEYTTPYPGFPDIEEPNTTQQTNRSSIKWKAWISTNTPVPTPYSYGDGVVGLFEGAHYHETGWYRPQLNCAMNSPGVPFCAVCSEALVLAIYQKVRPVDAFSPALTNLSITNTQPLTFNLTLLQPTTHSLSVQWYTNSLAVPGATNQGLTLAPTLLGSGSNRVSAIVRDNTPLVRNDPTNLLSQTVAWNLNVIRLDSLLWLAGGKFILRVSGPPAQLAVVQSSTNLVNWVPVVTNSLTVVISSPNRGQFWYTNSAAAASPNAFTGRFHLLKTAEVSARLLSPPGAAAPSEDAHASNVQKKGAEGTAP